MVDRVRADLHTCIPQRGNLLPAHVASLAHKSADDIERGAEAIALQHRQRRREGVLVAVVERQHDWLWWTQRLAAHTASQCVHPYTNIALLAEPCDLAIEIIWRDREIVAQRVDRLINRSDIMVHQNRRGRGERRDSQRWRGRKERRDRLRGGGRRSANAACASSE